MKPFPRRRGVVVVAGTLVALAAQPVPSKASVDDTTKGLSPLGDSPARGSEARGTVNSDLAFSGNLVFQGRYDGFRVVDVSHPRHPIEISRVRCHGAQGDLAVWGSLLFRAVDRPQTAPQCDAKDTAGATPGFEGIHIFSVKDPAKPRFLKAVPVDCGAHTMTLVPQQGRVLLYVSSSFPGFFGQSEFGNECGRTHGRIPIVTVPLAAPQTAHVAGSFRISGANHCHDIAVHLRSRRAVGACWPRANVWDISKPLDPKPLFSFSVSGVDGWHSAAFTLNGKVMVMGWEPGGGSQPECEPDDPVVERSVFFFRRDGRLIGQWTLRRFQTVSENCSIHNYNVVPLRSRNVLVSGNFQSGTSVVDFTNPRAPREVAFSDPDPLHPTQVGGTWSSYWYNGLIYESDITLGLRILWLKESLTPRSPMAHQLNPQTEPELLPHPEELMKPPIRL